MTDKCELFTCGTRHGQKRLPWSLAQTLQSGTTHLLKARVLCSPRLWCMAYGGKASGQLLLKEATQVCQSLPCFCYCAAAAQCSCCLSLLELMLVLYISFFPLCLAMFRLASLLGVSFCQFCPVNLQPRHHFLLLFLFLH
jgi:hypothetical protein